MQVIAFAASKGGVGKTTLAAGIAVEAARNARVAIADLDPQRCLERWHELRAQQPGPERLDAEAGLAALVPHAQRAGYDWLIVDTPPALMTHIASVIASVDLVVIPVRPSPLDVEAVEPVVELCRLYGRQFVFVVNAVPGQSSLTAGTVAYLQTAGRVLKTQIAARTSYAGAMITGRTAGEIESKGKAGDEVRSLWRELRQTVDATAAQSATRRRRT